MTGMTEATPVDAHIDRLSSFVTSHEFWVQEGVWARGSMVRIKSAFWLAALEQALPFALPETYRNFLRTCEHLAFEAGGIEFFPNTPHEPDSLLHHIFLDPVLSRVTLSAGLLQIGRPDTGIYDPVCLAVSHASSPNDAPILLLDHEEILNNERIVVEKVLYPSFRAFLALGAWA